MGCAVPGDLRAVRAHRGAAGPRGALLAATLVLLLLAIASIGASYRMARRAALVEGEEKGRSHEVARYEERPARACSRCFASRGW